MMSRRLPKKSKRFREAREQGAHDKVIPTHGSGASSLEWRERRLEALQPTSRRVKRRKSSTSRWLLRARSRRKRRVGETPGFARVSERLGLPVGGLPAWNATIRADRHGDDCPSAPAMQHSGGADMTVALHR